MLGYGVTGVTGAFLVTFLAWSLQLGLKLRNRRKRSTAKETPLAEPRHVCVLTPAAVQLLMEGLPFPHHVIEVHTGTDSGLVLPSYLSTQAVQVHVTNVQSLWEDHTLCRLNSSPSRQTLLVFAAREEHTARHAACLAAAAGYHRCAILATADVSLAAWSQAWNLQYIGRHAVAAILGYGQSQVAVPCLLLDVRRHDERALFGSIPGSVHIPVDILPAALAMSPEDFLKAHHFPKPRATDTIILYSRTGRRACWAAQVCMDAGLHNRVYVYKQGAYGWRFDCSVKAYREYDLDASGHVPRAPPDPEILPLETPDDSGVQELLALGLLDQGLTACSQENGHRLNGAVVTMS